MPWVSVKLDENKTVYTMIATREEQVDEAIKSLMSNRKRLIGLDIIPIRVAPGPSTTGKSSSAILQLSNSTICLIVRLHSFHAVPESLYNFLILPCFIFAGFGINDTIATLKQDYGLVCKSTLDVGSSMWKLLSCNFYKIGNVLKLMEIPPTSSISDAWGSSCELKEDEITLAVLNASAAYDLGSQILGYYSI